MDPIAPYCPNRLRNCAGASTVVMQRTLRRQAQEFLEVPFVERQTRLIEYSMSPEEKSLYDDVTSVADEAGSVCVPRQPAAFCSSASTAAWRLPWRRWPRAWIRWPLRLRGAVDQGSSGPSRSSVLSRSEDLAGPRPRRGCWRKLDDLAVRVRSARLSPEPPSGVLAG